MFNKIKQKAISAYVRASVALTSSKGEGYIDSAVVIIIAVVIGSLLLALLIYLWGDKEGNSGIAKQIKDAIYSMFGKVTP